MRRLTVAVLLAAAGAAAQEPPPAVVRLDAIVTDRLGRPLLDLKAAEFELRAGGVAQPIHAVELRRATAAASEASGRTLALFLDEFHVASGPNTDRVQEMLLRFVDEQIRPQDRVIVMKPLDSQLAIPFVSDRRALRSAIETFSGRAGDYTPRTEFEQQYLGHAPEAVETARRQIVTAAIRALVTRLGEVAAGRSAVAIVTEGVGTGGRSDRERRLPDLQTVARAASRFNVAVYAFDPSGRPPSADDKRSSSLRTLTADTGGEAAAGDQVSGALVRMMRDLDAYYVLTFQPSQRADGRFHRVELSTKRAGSVVRTRAGYWVPQPPAPARPDTTPPPMRALRRSSYIQSWYGLARLPDGTVRMRITWEPGARRSSAPEKQPAAVVVRAARRQGAALFEGSIARVGSADATGAPQLAEFVVPTGRIELDLAVIAADGSRLDVETRDVDVPDQQSLRTSGLVPEIVRAATVRDFRTFGPDPQAPPTPLRQFRRADRLLVRVPALAADGSRMAVSAKLLNRWGQPMRDLAELPLSSDAVVQFDLPLAWLAAGEYELAVTASSGGADTMHRIAIKVTG